MESISADQTSHDPKPATTCSSRSRVLIAILLLGCLALGCAESGLRSAWGARFGTESGTAPLPPIAIVISDLDSDLAKTNFEDFERRSLTRLSQLAEIFYQRLSHRRVNSISTFHDPALREFFQSEEAFADYYADLVQALDTQHFQANRPQKIDLLSLHVEEAADRVVAVVEFHGDNSLPLRFWSVDYSRRDVWEQSGDRWWWIHGLVGRYPGKGEMS
jgi:hypothetical protein